MKLKKNSWYEQKGWLFDAYPSSGGMVLWVITEEGQRLRLVDSFHPSFYFEGPPDVLRTVFLLLSREATPVTAKQVERIEFLRGRPIPVVQVTVKDPARFSGVVKKIARVSDRLLLYNCDINLAQLYFYERKIFPLALCCFTYTEAGRILSVRALDSPWDLDYPFPPLRFLSLKLEGECVNPNHGWQGRLEIQDEGESYLLEGEDPAELITQINSHLHRRDPDLIFTDWGDSFILPRLQRIARGGSRALAFNRDSGMEIAGKEPRSYASYGRIVYTAGAQTLFGRWHIDRQNSFILHEAGLEGLLEQARVTKLPVQHMARTSPGTGVTSMQLEIAHREGILIPWRKREPEEFKSAFELLTIDKGGLVFLPQVGFEEGIAELDFASMYPSIMARFNISPETVGCACCPWNRVPETGYSVCTRRRGLVPKTLQPLLDKRTRYKKRLKSATDPERRERYDRRQTALKWLLVTCLAGDTLVPMRTSEGIEVRTIQDFVDAFIPGLDGVKEMEGGIWLFGFNERLEPIENPVRKVIKLPAPDRMLRIRLERGRSITVTPDHRCYVLENGELTEKRADQLRPGEWMPVASRFPSFAKPIEEINLVEKLLTDLTEAEQPNWRVFGQPLKTLISYSYKEVLNRALGKYTYKTIWNWREYGYLPLSFISALSDKEIDFRSLSVGKGKLSGGVIQRIPVLIRTDFNLGFLLGYFTGDGNSRGNMVRFAINGVDDDVLEKLSAIIREKFHLLASIRREQHAFMYLLQVNSLALKEILRVCFGLGESAARGRLNVPSAVLNGPVPVQYGFLSGLIASDGHIDRTRDFIGISSASDSFLLKVGFVCTLLGLGYRLHQVKHRLYALELSGLETLREFFQHGWLKRRHSERIIQRIGKIRVERSSREIPVIESGLLRLAQKTRKTRFPRITHVGAISRKRLLQKILQIERQAKAFTDEERDLLSKVRALAVSPLVFSRIDSIEPVTPPTDFVYCFELEQKIPGFTVKGGMFTGNCFGYLGYKNARFGRIEAHECVTAYSREKLLRAKEIAEGMGYRLVHAIVDSVWVKKAGATEQDYQKLAYSISRETGLPISLEGIYRWIGFLPSKTRPRLSVPSRFLGVFYSGAVKVRGLEVRRSDAPPLVRSVQSRMIEVLAQARNVKEYQASIPQALEVLAECRQRLREGRVPRRELVITRSLSQDPQSYEKATLSAVVAQELLARGIKLAPGESIQYIITHAADRDPASRAKAYASLTADHTCDTEKYTELLLKSAESLFSLFGYDLKRLDALTRPGSFR